MSKSSGTPARNNYACPQSPIASAKRPRSSLDRPSGVSGNGMATPMKADVANPMSPSMKASVYQELSPMHPPRPVLSRDEDDGAETDNTSESASWVGRKVDALFSPVLSFLSAGKEDEDVAAVTDEDATMEEPKNHHSADDDTQPTSSTSNLMFKDSEDDDYEDPSRTIEEDPSSSFEEEEFNPFLFIKCLPPYSTVQSMRPPITLPPKDPSAPKISLVLDLDETLVHCTVEPTDQADLLFPVVFHGITYQVNVRLRPHLFTFLEKIKDKFEVIIFTASQEVYANELLNLIDPDGKYIHYRLYRDSCLAVDGNYLKDLNVLGRDLSKTVLVDNSPHAFGYQVDNGIPIESWFDDPHDTELLKLERFLRTLHKVEDVTLAVRYKFQTYQLIEES